MDLILILGYTAAYAVRSIEGLKQKHNCWLLAKMKTTGRMVSDDERRRGPKVFSETLGGF